MERKALPEHFKDVFMQPRIKRFFKNSQSNLNLKLLTLYISQINSFDMERLPLKFGKEISALK